MRPRMVLLPLFLTLMLGCTQTLKNTAISQKTEFQKSENDQSASISENTPNLQTESSEHDQPEIKIGEDDVCLPDMADLDELIAFPLENSEGEESETELKNDNEDKAPEKEEESDLDVALELCQMAQDLWQQGDLDSAIDALDQAYSLILRIDTVDRPKLLQQTDDLRFMISKRILEIYASRHIVVNGKHNAIPLEMNSHVQHEIDLLTRGNMKFFIRAYKRSGKYRPMIVAELEKAGLPVELSWLPLIESGYKNNALSRARALGLWQFIPSTGYKFGLKRDRYIDERMDPEKSTKAAIGYLKELHQIFGDWSTVLAAYNCGEGRVLKVIRNQNINYLDNFWDLYRRLPRETARYVPKFLAVLHIVNNPEKYGIDSVIVCKPADFETVTVSKRVHLKGIADALGIPDNTLLDLNPELRYKILPDTDYSLKIPIGLGDALLTKIDGIPVSSTASQTVRKSGKKGTWSYKVRSGDTLSKIAKRYNVSVKNIVRTNKIGSRHFIVAGDILKIPYKGYRSKKYAKPKYKRASKRKIVSGGRHVVRSGDNLWIIARKYGTTTKAIRKLNKLPNTRLHIGQVLKIPKSGRTSRSASISTNTGTYQVKNGDVPSGIAQKHNIPLRQLLEINNLSASAKIYPGQMLHVE